MKRKLLILIIVIVSIGLFAYSNVVKVTLKNGTSITGELKELKPNDHITISVAGIVADMDMSEVLSIEEVAAQQPENVSAQISIEEEALVRKSLGKGTTRNSAGVRKLISGEYIITDKAQYPESFVISVLGQDLHMILVRGGTFNMGYESHMSRFMDSEPIHQVTLSSFYVSKELIDCGLAQNLLRGKSKQNNAKNLWNVTNWKEASKAVDKIASMTGFPCRMITEAEWEYMALQHIGVYITEGISYEWCSDIFGEYPSFSQINPKGAKKGSSHVKRSYNEDKNKYIWYRYHDSSNNPVFLRIVIDANALHF